MLKKLLRAPLPEQIIALLEKLEQNPDASHLDKVERLLDYHRTRLTRYETWLIKREMRKVRHVIRREETLNNVMSIVINEPTDAEQQHINYMKTALGQSTGTISGALSKHEQGRIARIYAQQQLMNQAQIGYPTGNFIDPRSYWTSGSSQ